VKAKFSMTGWLRASSVSILVLLGVIGLSVQASASTAPARSVTGSAASTVTTVKQGLSLDCAAMSASVHSYAVAHGYCATNAISSDGARPADQEDGTCGSSSIYIYNDDDGGQALFVWGFSSSDGSVIVRNLEISWSNWTQLYSGGYSDVDGMANANYVRSQLVNTGTGFVANGLSGSITLWWGGVCTIENPTSSTDVT